MISFEDVLHGLVDKSEAITVSSAEDFCGLHKWMLAKGYLRRDEAVLMFLQGATYVVYPEYPVTTIVIRSNVSLTPNAFSCITHKHLYGQYKPGYNWQEYILEVLKENWPGLIVSTLAGWASLSLTAGDIEFVIDKSVDVAAISAAFLTLFLSLKADVRSADRLWFKLGDYRKHYRVDKYSLFLMIASIGAMFLAFVSVAMYDDQRYGRVLSAVSLGIGWFMLYASFRSLVTYHIDRMETEGEKELADEVRKLIAASANNGPSKPDGE